MGGNPPRPPAAAGPPRRRGPPALLTEIAGLIGRGPFRIDLARTDVTADRRLRPIRSKRSKRSKRRVGFHPTTSPTPDARPTSPSDVRRAYSPKPPSGTVPDHSGSTRPRAMSRWMEECGHSTARATNPCFTGLSQQYRTCAAKSASSRMWCSQ